MFGDFATYFEDGAEGSPLTERLGLVEETRDGFYKKHCRSVQEMKEDLVQGFEGLGLDYSGPIPVPKTMEMCGIEKNIQANLMEHVGPNNLWNSSLGPCLDAESVKEIPENVPLKTLNVQKDWLAAMKFRRDGKLPDRCCDVEYYARKNYNHKLINESSSEKEVGGKLLTLKDIFEAEEKEKSRNAKEAVNNLDKGAKIKCREIGLLVALYKVVDDKFVANRRQQSVMPHVIQEFLCVGGQKLTDLRDLIHCPAELAVLPESDTPEPSCSSGITLFGDHYKSAYFYINGVFYNDMRHPENIALSRSTAEWLTIQCKFAPCLEKNMEDTCFDELSIVLGHPYLYRHLASCEHLLVFTDVRMIGPGDPAFMQDYPQNVRAPLLPLKMCEFCARNHAIWVCHDDELVPYSPCHLCDACFRTSHYDKKTNRRLGKFQAQMFFRPSPISSATQQ